MGDGDRAGVRRMCAWCGRLVDAANRPVSERLPLSAGSTHGICVECRPGFLAEVEAMGRSMALISPRWR